MQVLIETYRGWEIYFDIEVESFYCHSERYDRDQKKQSFAATKKYIDDYIKENSNFKPFKIEKLPSGYGDRYLTVVGIRKDGALMVEDSKGVKKQLFKYGMKYYILRTPDNDPINDEIKDLEVKITELNRQIRELQHKITGTSLTDYLESIKG